MKKRFKLIVNPSAGVGRPLLREVNNAFTGKNVYWNVDVTLGRGDAYGFAKNAVREGFDAVIVYGGDGTVMEAGSGLIGSEIPLLALRGGTGNVMATEFDVPVSIKESCELLLNEKPREKWIDFGQYDNGYFIERISFGIEAEMMKSAARESKNRIGNIAYTISGIRSVLGRELVKYKVDIDGKRKETEGYTCIIANSGSIGVHDLKFAPGIDISDGKLDLIILHRLNFTDFFRIATHMIHERGECDAFSTFQAKDIRVEAFPLQNVQCDGEVIRQKKVHAHILPHALKVITG
jgi:YegS/Rv2252/BmrU family lipid kinase